MVEIWLCASIRKVAAGFNCDNPTAGTTALCVPELGSFSAFMLTKILVKESILLSCWAS